MEQEQLSSKKRQVSKFQKHLKTKSHIFLINQLIMQLIMQLIN